MNKQAGLFLSILFGLTLANGLWGARIYWTNPDGGSFEDTSNWSNGVLPGADDIAFFDLGGSYSVNLGEDYTVKGIHLPISGTAGELNLNLGGYTLNATSTEATGGNQAFFVSGVGEDPRLLRIENGTLKVEVSRIGQTNRGEIVIENGGVLSLGGATNRIGDNGGTGWVRVGDGGTLELVEGRGLQIGALAAGMGYLEARGSTAQINASGVGSTVFMGLNTSTGHVVITEGAKANFREMRLGAGAEGEGYLEVSQGAKLFTESIVYVGFAGSGHALFTSGAEIQTVGINLRSNGLLEIDDATAVLTSNNSRTWEEGSIYRLHLNAVDATPLSLNHIEIASTLEVHLGANFVAELGNVYTVMEYSGVLDGYFRSEDGSLLEDGDQIVIGGHVFDLHYGGRTEGGIVGLELVAIPEPGFAVLIAAIASLVLVVTIKRKNG